MFKRLFGKKEKSFYQTGGNNWSINSINSQIREGLIRPYFETYIRFYQSISPLGDAIDLISTLFSGITPKLYDIKTKLYVEDHPFLDLLENPNTNTLYTLFAERSSGFFELTGNCFWMMTLSKIDGEPLDLMVIPPQWLSQSVGNNGYVNTYIYSPPQAESMTFTRQPLSRSKRYIYLSDDGTKQLFLLQNFNPNSSNFLNLGVSKLHSLFYQLEQFRLASIHNQALLSNQGRPSGMLKSSEGTLSVDQLNSLRAELDNMYAGATNAGRMMVTSDLEWVPFSQSIKDMDFATLKNQTKEEIYNRLRIPLSLVNSTALSLANMEVASLQLYDLAVLPMTQRIYDTLTINVLRRYNRSENLILTYDEATIPSIKDRSVEQVTKIAALNVMSDNEIRDKIDLPPYVGGDIIFKPSNYVPESNINPDETVTDEKDDEEGKDETDQ
jgi:HK97 family phage portal protein